MEDIRSLGLGNQISSVSLIILMWPREDYNHWLDDFTQIEICYSIIKQQLNQGINERVDNAMPIYTKKFYLPHHPVFTPHKATTKICIV